VIRTVGAAPRGRPAPARSCSTFPARCGPTGRRRTRWPKRRSRRCCRDSGRWANGCRRRRSALLRAGDLSEADFVTAVDRLRAGEAPADALDARFVAAFRDRRHRGETHSPRRGATVRPERASSCSPSSAAQPEADMADLARCRRVCENPARDITSEGGETNPCSHAAEPVVSAIFPESARESGWSRTSP
jgi:hypothetical protein